jgi:hypothetical protein
MQLVHYSSAPVTEIRSTDPADGRNVLGKPYGFWFSVDGNGDGWHDWCLDERFRLDSLTHVHDVELADGAEVLRLSSGGEIDHFNEAYRGALPSYLAGAGLAWSDRLRGIDWKRVGSRYRGIIISPYIWDRRLSGPFWYYGWDCASGCIWDATAIRSITLREIVPEPVFAD